MEIEGIAPESFMTKSIEPEDLPSLFDHLRGIAFCTPEKARIGILGRLRLRREQKEKDGD